jgi:hypothetical protein
MREHEHDRKVDRLLGAIATGNLTLDELQRAVTDGRADAKRLGPRVESTSLDALAAGEEALERIKNAQGLSGISLAGQNPNHAKRNRDSALPC